MGIERSAKLWKREVGLALGSGAGDFHHAQECILQGELATQGSILEIKRQLEA